MDIELVKHAKDYIDKLAQGVNPLTNEAVKDDDIVNNVKISRCLFFVSDVLRQVIDAPPKAKGTGGKKLPFNITREQLAGFKFSSSMTITEMVGQLNELAADENIKKLPVGKVTDWLVENGILQEHINDSGKVRKLPTEAAAELGIYTEERTGVYGTYLQVLYNTEGQQFILDNIEAIIAFIS